MAIRYGNSWLTCAAFCLAGFALGYIAKQRVDLHQEGSVTHVQMNWNRAARRRWPGLSEWSDAQINTMLDSPAGFRSAFDECGTKDDQEIGAIVGKDPGDIYHAGVTCLPPVPKGYTLDMSTYQPISNPPGSVPPNWTK